MKAPGLSALELAAGHPLGFLDGRSSWPEVDASPMAALEDVVREAVRRPPCCVAFSGGRDSSLVLAAAVRAARQAGTRPPVAVTLRFPAIAATDERHWQELVVDHLGAELRAIDLTDELDLVGPLAGAELLRRGVLFPPNLHLMTPLLPHAAGGTLLIGIGGDEFLGDHAFEQLNDLLAGRRRPASRDAVRVGASVLPAALRGRLLERRTRMERPWLRRQTARRLRAFDARVAAEPVRFDRAVAGRARARYLHVALDNLERLSASAGVTIEAPLASPRFLAALARAGGARGWGDRAATMRAVAGEILPERLLARRSKARFDTVFFGAASRRFAEEWSGDGLDTSLVDPVALRRAWLELDQPFRTAMLLQAAWLHDHEEASPTGAETRASDELLARPPARRSGRAAQV